MCPIIVIINLTNFLWNTHDIKIAKLAQKRCKKFNLPCVKSFKKVGKQSYTVMCTYNRKK